MWPDPLNRLQHPLVMGLHARLKWNLLTRRAIAVIHLPRGHLKALKISLLSAVLSASMLRAFFFFFFFFVLFLFQTEIQETRIPV